MEPSYDLVLGFLAAAISRDMIRKLIHDGYTELLVAPVSSKVDDTLLSRGLNLVNGHLIFSADIGNPVYSRSGPVSRLNMLTQKIQGHISYSDNHSPPDFQFHVLLSVGGSSLHFTGGFASTKKCAKSIAALTVLQNASAQSLLGLSLPPPLIRMPLGEIYDVTSQVLPALILSSLGPATSDDQIQITKVVPATPKSP